MTLGLAQWITLVETDDATESLRIEITHYPERQTSERVICFNSVSKILFDWEDRDDGCLESIIGAFEDIDGDQLRYMIRTDQRTIWIWTKSPVALSVNSR